MYARTIVLELLKRADEAAKREDDAAKHEETAPARGADLLPDEESEPVDMRAMSVLSYDGSLFDCWVIGDKPALVTVRHPTLGKLSGFTEEAPEPFAMDLAKQLVDRHAKLSEAERAKAATVAPAGTDGRAPSPLKKPGWFEK
jgi:hypothetical protein